MVYNPFAAAKKKSSVLNNTFPTIALLTEGLSGEYQAGVWPGIVDSVHLNCINLLCYCGGSLSVSAQDPWDSQGNVLYTLAEKNDLDGIIIAGSLGSYISDNQIIEFLNKYSRLPAVTLAPTTSEIPAIYVDNRSGMRSLITHLVEHHGYRKVAFIRGPEGNIEAEERFRLFKQVLHDHALPINEDCIINGDFTRQCGAEAVKYLRNAKIDVEVIVAADDETALGALQTLQEYDKRVPEDVALVGFDDISETRYVTPSLTTVNQPLYDLGKTAVETLLKLIKKEKIPQNTILEAKLIIRQSCGCFSYATDYNKLGQTVINTVSSNNFLAEKDVFEHIITDMNHSYADFTRKIVSQFCIDVNKKQGDSFLQSVESLGHQLVSQNKKLSVWQKTFSELWAYCLSHLDLSTFALADYLLHRACMICGELGIREQGFSRIQTLRGNYSLHEIGDVLKNTLDITRLMDTIAELLPKLGIESFYVSLYEADQMPSAYSRLLLACTNGKKLDIGEQGIVFETVKLLPIGIAPQNMLHVLVAEPLYFQREQFGIMLFEEKTLDNERYEILREYISGALHSALLVSKIQLQTENLTKANIELEELRKKEHAYLEAIKGELELGRKIQMSFLPQELPQPAGYELSVAFMPAREVSGDFYDVFLMGKDTLALVIADVSGKDVSAALFMSLIRTLIRVFSEQALVDGKDPLNAIEVVNNYIIQHHRYRDGRCMFATIVLGLLKPATGEFSYVNAGHNAPILIKKSMEMKELPPTGPAVGLAAELTFKKEKIIIEPGELLFSYTDGVTEAQGPSGEFFTIDRLKNILKKSYATAIEKVQQIKDSLHEHIKEANPFDDITILAIKRK